MSDWLTSYRLNGPAEWYACEHPERLCDPAVRWHYSWDGIGCRGCAIKADAIWRQAEPGERHNVDWLVAATRLPEPIT